jgi:hypothetical protein
MHPDSIPPLVLDRARRDALWALAADDLDGLGDDLHHAGARRALALVAEHADALRAVLALLEAIGWDLHDPRDEYPVAPAVVEPLLARWRGQVDDAIRGDVVGPFADEGYDVGQVDADLDARHVLDGLLEEVAR